MCTRACHSGSRFGYTLLFIVMASNLMAILLKSLNLKLGVVTERDLAQLCRESFGPKAALLSGSWLKLQSRPEIWPGASVLLSRSIASIHTIVVVAVAGEQGPEKLLILSNVILPLQWSFAVVRW